MNAANLLLPISRSNRRIKGNNANEPNINSPNDEKVKLQTNIL
jgi:hypothetical protein